jgi:rhamnulokinase
MHYHLAVDIGASGGRHILGWLEDGRICTKEVYRFENGASMKDGHLCWDIDGLFHHVVQGLAACREAGCIPETMGIDTWAVDFALLDGEDHRMGDVVAYRDERTNGMDTLLEKTLPFGDHYQLTGIAKQPFNTVYQLMAVFREHPEYRQSAQDFLLVPEYLNYLLTGKKLHEWTNVSTTSLADAATHTWAPKVLEAAELPEQIFRTPIALPGTALGTLLPEVKAQVGFDVTVVLPATHDTGSAYMSVPAKDDSSAFLSSGTWSLLGTELSTPCTDEGSRLAGFTNEGGWAYTTRYLKNIMGMWMLQCLRHENADRYSYAEMATMAAESSYTAYVDAADNRFLAPASMEKEVRAALKEQGAPEPATLGDLYRAVTLGLAACYRDSIAEMARLTGRKFTAVNIVGGGSQNRTLDQLTADMTGLPVLAGPTEGTALGNLAAQMIASGELDSLEAFRKLLPDSFPIDVYEPRK